MARNYTEIWISKIQSGGRTVSFIKGSQPEVIDAAKAYIAAHGGTINYTGARAYFLMNKTNLVALLGLWATFDVELLDNSWSFFQDGGRAKESPRKSWSNGE
jgi:hypothetical protein